MRGDVMNIFIAGARSIKTLDENVLVRLRNISDKGLNILIGDCYGVDTAVQKYFHKLNNHNITIYANNGKPRNNVGNWNVHSVVAPSNIRGFDYYALKDVAMADDADHGFMIWDGESRGTLNNIINLIIRNKHVLVYYTKINKMLTIKDIDSLEYLIGKCSAATQRNYINLINKHALSANAGF